MSRRWISTLLVLVGILALAVLATRLALHAANHGPLSAAHATVLSGGGWLTCRQCHADAGMSAGCSDCHQEIAGQQASNDGYHGLLARQGKRDCQTCHPEHLGEDFQLVGPVAWQGQDPNAFVHEHVNFTLRGRHDALQCEDCHNETYATPFALQATPELIRVHSFLGLRQACIACHEDIHAGGQAADCASCHDQNAFKPAPHFRHDDYFILEGAHVSAPCADCHLWGEPNAIADDVPAACLPFQQVRGKTCVACHASPHRTDLGQDCTRCHWAADASWTLGQRGMDLLTHARTGFPLEAAHETVACEKCHTPDLPYTIRYPDPRAPDYRRRSAQCVGCHRDPHGAQFAARYPSCADCHAQTQWHPSTITVARHNERFVLAGAHAQVACDKCHQKQAEAEMKSFVGVSKLCRDCHQDPHQGQFKDRYRSCADCHGQTRFLPVHYTLDQHETVYPLTGAHRAVACTQCHRPSTEFTGARRYPKTPQTCAACHRDIHRGQFRREGPVQCETCHSRMEFWIADRFDHEKHTSFPLEGQHQKVTCAQCHPVAQQPDGTLLTQYRPITIRCEDCHGFVP